MGFAFPKEWRQALVDSEPEKFSLPSEHDMRYHWVHVDLAAIDEDEMRDLVEDAWAFCVPKSVAEEYAATQDVSGRASQIEFMRIPRRGREGRVGPGDRRRDGGVTRGQTG